MGPGQYNPRLQSTKEPAQFGSLARFKGRESNKRVGPGSYETGTGLNQKSFKMKEPEKALILQIQLEREMAKPGPGAYQVESAMGVMPAFENRTHLASSFD